MFSRIVVGTDGSIDATEALKVAGQMAASAPDAVVHVVTGFEPLSTTEMQKLDSQLPREYRDQVKSDLLARPAVENAAGLLTARGIAHTVREAEAKPAAAILALAKEVDADLIVVGSRGEGMIDRLRHGSTSTKVLHEARCNVLVVKHRD